MEGKKLYLITSRNKYNKLFPLYLIIPVIGSLCSLHMIFIINDGWVIPLGYISFFISWFFMQRIVPLNLRRLTIPSFFGGRIYL